MIEKSRNIVKIEEKKRKAENEQKYMDFESLRSEGKSIIVSHGC